jgi:thiol-disulfide isomerase/thioredoxin
VKNILAIAFLVLFSYGLGNTTAGAVSPDSVEMLDFNEFEHWLYKDTDSVYVVNFWATWCAPCVREIPAFEEIHAKYSPEKVKVVLVSLDFPNQLESRVLPFMERMNIQSKVILLDDPYSNRWIGRVSEEWSGAIPATVIYSKDYRAFFEREFKFEELEEIIKPLIQ